MPIIIALTWCHGLMVYQITSTYCKRNSFPWNQPIIGIFLVVNFNEYFNCYPRYTALTRSKAQKNYFFTQGNKLQFWCINSLPFSVMPLHYVSPHPFYMCQYCIVYRWFQHMVEWLTHNMLDLHTALNACLVHALAGIGAMYAYISSFIFLSSSISSLNFPLCMNYILYIRIGCA